MKGTKVIKESNLFTAKIEEKVQLLLNSNRGRSKGVLLSLTFPASIPLTAKKTKPIPELDSNSNLLWHKIGICC